MGYREKSALEVEKKDTEDTEEEKTVEKHNVEESDSEDEIEQHNSHEELYDTDEVEESSIS